MWFLVFLVIYFLALAVRWSRWLSILQQKEYRFDRLMAFFQSAEGKQELARVLPLPADFTRAGLKRPKLTARVAIVALLSGALLLLELYGSFILSQIDQATGSIYLPTVLMYLLAIYIFVPLTVVVGALPSMVIAAVITYRKLLQAQRKLISAVPQIIGIGGSYGKTSTKHLLHHFLSQKYTVFVTPRSFNTKLSVAQSILDGYKKQQIAILEYGAYIRGEIEYLSRWFPPMMAVETGFTPQHLSLFGSRENSLLAEAELIAALPKDGKVFCNGADAGAVEICRTGARNNSADIFMYSGPESKVKFTDIEINEYGQLRVSWKGKRLQTRLIGRQYTYNLQAAVLVSEELGLSQAEIQSAMTSFKPNSSFIEGAILKNDAYVIDDGGTSNPMGFASSIELLAELPQPKKILVTAGMIDLGDESRQIHFKLAKRAKELGLTVIHLGIDGHDEFQEVFDHELVTTLEAAHVMIDHADQATVILVEGKVPKLLENHLQQLTKRKI